MWLIRSYFSHWNCYLNSDQRNQWHRGIQATNRPNSQRHVSQRSTKLRRCAGVQSKNHARGVTHKKHSRYEDTLGTEAQVSSCEFCEISKNTFFTEHLRATASVNCFLQWGKTPVINTCYVGVVLMSAQSFYLQGIFCRILETTKSSNLMLCWEEKNISHIS